MAYAAYDRERLRAMAGKGAIAVISNSPSGVSKYPIGKHLYAQHHLV